MKRLLSTRATPGSPGRSVGRGFSVPGAPYRREASSCNAATVTVRNCRDSAAPRRVVPSPPERDRSGPVIWTGRRRIRVTRIATSGSGHSDTRFDGNGCYGVRFAGLGVPGNGCDRHRWQPPGGELHCGAAASCRVTLRRGRQIQMIRTRLTELVGCTAPIQQAPMGTVSSPRLAVAVAEAGGIGSFNTLGVTRETLKQQLDGMREQTDGVLAVSFLTDDIDADALTDAASRVRVVDFFWSPPPGPGRHRPQVWSAGQLAGRIGGGGVCGGLGAPIWSAPRVSRPAVTVAATAPCFPCSARCSTPSTCPSSPPEASPTPAVWPPLSQREPRACGWERDSSPQRNRQRIPTTLLRSSRQAHTARGSRTRSMTVRCARRPRDPRVPISAIDAVEAIDVDVVGTKRGADGEIPVPRRSWIPPTKDVSGHIEAMCMYAGESVALVNTVMPASQLVRSLIEDAGELLERVQRG